MLRSTFSFCSRRVSETIAYHSPDSRISFKPLFSIAMYSRANGLVRCARKLMRRQRRNIRVFNNVSRGQAHVFHGRCKQLNFERRDIGGAGQNRIQHSRAGRIGLNHCRVFTVQTNFLQVQPCSQPAIRQMVATLQNLRKRRGACVLAFWQCEEAAYDVVDRNRRIKLGAARFSFFRPFVGAVGTVRHGPGDRDVKRAQAAAGFPGASSSRPRS